MEKVPFCLIGPCWDWCGRPCLHDPSKSNALIFHKDGTEKTLEERGLGWRSPPLDSGAVRRSIEDLKGVVIGKHGPGAVTKIPPISVTSVTNNPPVTEKVFERLKRGRPKKQGALSAAERKRLSRAKQKPVDK
jgi:hypothetical protein